MPEKEGAEEKSTKSVVNKKQKQMMGEEGYDHLRDMGRIRKNKKKKDATTMPPSKEMEKTRKVNKGPSALELVKKKYKGQIMDVKKEELDLTKVAETFGGYIVEAPVDREGNITSSQKDIRKQRKLLSKTEKQITGKNIDIPSERKILGAQQDPDLKKLDKIDKAQDKLLDKVNRKPIKGGSLSNVRTYEKTGDKLVDTTPTKTPTRPKITGDVPSGQGNILTGGEDPLKPKRKSGGGRPRGSRSKIKPTPGQQSLDLGDYGRKARRRTPNPKRLERIKKQINIKEPTYVSPKTGKKLPIKLGKNLKNIGATSTKSVQSALKQGAKTTAKTALKKGAVKGTGKLIAKRIPGIGAAISGAETFGRAASGDYVGAAISGAETIANLIPGVQQTIGTGLAGLGMARDIRKASQIKNVAKKTIQTAKAARGRKGFSAFMKPARQIKKKYAKMPDTATELGKKIRGKTPLGRRLRAAAVGQEFLPGGGIGRRTLKALKGVRPKSPDGSHVGRRTAG